MERTSICLKSTFELLKESFFIPSYQRGYRWKPQQVRELLEDLAAFEKSDARRRPEGFYCLQPVVVKRRTDRDAWEVVDGQQRLTTILLLMQFFNQGYVEARRKPVYRIEFETRPECEVYLASPDPQRSKENADFFHLYNASLAVSSWFEGKDNLLGALEDALLNRVKVIWYELPQGESAVNAFTRLNVGKIPLTDAELVRALLLKSPNFKNEDTREIRQLQMAQEWDLIERALQDNDFWYFLTNRDTRANRIELIFDVIVATAGGTTQGDGLTCFHHFSRLLENGKAPEQLWNDVKFHFMTFEEWFRDPELFHLTGYLIHEGTALVELVSLNRDKGKQAFRQELRGLIWQQCFVGGGLHEMTHEQRFDTLDEQIRSLVYERDSRRIKSILLLFNIASIVANEKSIVRFRFDHFKHEHWDIEHIRSVATYRPVSNADKRGWLEVICEHFGASGQAELLRRVREMLGKRSYTTGDQFDELYDEIVDSFGESTEVNHGIGNLALLDAGTNRGYRNAPFPVKRRKLLDRDQAGTFVPLCTRNAFLKCHSKNLDKMLVWGKEDQEGYQQAIVEMLAGFFNS